MRKVTTKDLIEYISKYELQESATDYLIETLNSEPSRRVGENARFNVSGAYSSPSQGLTIQYESHTSELAWLVRWELDPNVIGFRDQPPAVEFRKPDKNCIERLTRYTPDFLVFHIDNVRVVEVKTTRELQKLSKKYPGQWKQDLDGWHYIPAEEYFAKHGLVHVVCTLSHDHAVETSNVKLLVRAQNVENKLDKNVISKIDRELDVCSWLTIAELLDRVPEISSIDIYHLILGQVLHVNIKDQLLSDFESCYVSSDIELLKLRETRDAWPIQEIENIDCIRVPSKDEMKKAIQRLNRIHNNDGSRHTRRLKKRLSEKTANGYSPLQAMVMPHKGSKNSKLEAVVRVNLIDHIRTVYMHKRKPSKYFAWTCYRNWAKEQHPSRNPVSLNTYKKYVRDEDSEAVAFARGGKRAANAASATTDVTSRAILAIRPFERASVDHTLLKMMVKVVDSNGEKITTRPWLTVLMDDYSGYWISYFITLKDPSKRTLSMLFRTCVREHGLLPEVVHADRGADFTSSYHQSLLAHYGITHDSSPAANSRFNSQVERINKLVKDQWVANRPGSTVDYLNARKYSKGHRPKDLAEINLEALFYEINTFKNIYNETIIGTEFESPKSKFEDGLKRFEFSGIRVCVNDEFHLITAHDTDKSNYKIRPNGEIVYNGLHYFHRKLEQFQPKRAHTELRIDPEDPYLIYCKVESEWITALNSKHKSFTGKAGMIRWAEAVKVSQGRPYREKAKQNSADLRAKAIEKYDAQYKEIENTCSKDIEVEVEDIFERLKRVSINKPEEA